MKSKGHKTVLITGATDGIGRIVCDLFARDSYKLILHGRDREKLNTVRKQLEKNSQQVATSLYCADFSSLDEVRSLANSIGHDVEGIDILLNNAGAGFAAPRYGKDGTETRFTVNYLAPFLLTHLLLPTLLHKPGARIVNVASAGQSAIDINDLMSEKNFDSVKAYCRSKLALIMFTIELSEKLRNKEISVNALHPGTYLDTSMVREAGISPHGKAESGAEAEYFLCTNPSLANVTGTYFDVKTEAVPHRQAFDESVREALWKKSLEITGIPDLNSP